MEPFTANPQVPIVVQFGTMACALCPDVSRRINALMQTHVFEWHYHDATTSNLAVELTVSKLPAMLVFHTVEKYELYQKMRGDDVEQAIRASCAARLVLDEDI